MRKSTTLFNLYSERGKKDIPNFIMKEILEVAYLEGEFEGLTLNVNKHERALECVKEMNVILKRSRIKPMKL